MSADGFPHGSKGWVVRGSGICEVIGREAGSKTKKPKKSKKDKGNKPTESYFKRNNLSEGLYRVKEGKAGQVMLAKVLDPTEADAEDADDDEQHHSLQEQSHLQAWPSRPQHRCSM